MTDIIIRKLSEEREDGNHFLVANLDYMWFFNKKFHKNQESVMNDIVSRVGGKKI